MENEMPEGASQEFMADSVFKMVICQKCGKRMLLEVGAESRQHRCPVCRVLFQTTWENGALTVVYDPD
ncbi:MAG: hypothetical protein WCK63_00145 [Betaproteobacteria bacterium]